MRRATDYKLEPRPPDMPDDVKGKNCPHCGKYVPERDPCNGLVPYMSFGEIIPEIDVLVDEEPGSPESEAARLAALNKVKRFRKGDKSLTKWDCVGHLFWHPIVMSPHE